MLASLVVLPRVAVAYEMTHRMLEPILAREGITMATFELLSAIDAANGEATQTELATRLGIKPPSLSESIRQALERGYVEQRVPPKDRRARIVRLTKRGRKRLRTCLEAMEAAEQIALTGLSEEERLQLGRLLNRVAVNLAARSALIGSSPAP